MSTISDRLYKWSLEELNLVSEGGSREVPDLDVFKNLTKGKNAKIWNYVINHVRSQSAVEKIKRTLYARKCVKEKEIGTPIIKIDNEIVKIQTSVSKALEKRSFLTRKLTAIEESILRAEQNTDKIIDETDKIYHKVGILELLRKKCCDKNKSMKVIGENLAAHISYLSAYQSSSKISTSDISLTYGFLYDDRLNYGVDTRLREIIKALSTFIEAKLSSEEANDDILCEIIVKNNQDLKDSGFLLTDLVSFLNNMSNVDKQQFTTSILQSSSVKDFILQSRDKNAAKQLLCQMKYYNVDYSLSVLKNKKKISDLNTSKIQICQDEKVIARNDMTGENIFDIKCSLLEKLSENEALIICNSNLEENLKIITTEAEKIEKECEKISGCELNSNIQKFYKQANMTFYLLNTVSDAFQKVQSVLCDLRLFAQNEIFTPRRALPPDCLQALKDTFISDRKLMWEFCEKINLICPKKYDPYNILYPLPDEIKNLLFVEPYETFAVACKNAINLKEEIKSEALGLSKYTKHTDVIDSSQANENITKTLEKMRRSINDGMTFINKGMSGCERNKHLIEEWWEQKAQFIPHIEHEGKNLKMWIDILQVLDDFKSMDVKS